jgi:CRISPR-associated protein Cmr6
MKNAGWLFYRDYYKSLSDDKLKKFVATGKLGPKEQVFFKQESDALLEFKWDNSHNRYFTKGNHTSIQFETTYPGLLVGSGYSHQTGSMGEFKLGFFFDHATGLPVIPGSSVKGLLRSAFPNEEKRDGVKKMKTEFVKGMLSGIRKPLGDIDISILENLIFTGKIPKSDEYLPMYKHDVFHDAFIVGTSNENKGKIFGEDYITPHPHPLKNPTPVRFMKILPGVIFQFNFDLKDSKVGDLVLSAEEKCDLFKQIILLFGIGAKTNVGYGQFV